MSKYGNVAVMAAEMARSGLNPIEAWKVSAKVVFPTQQSSRDKGCPSGRGYDPRCFQGSLHEIHVE